MTLNIAVTRKIIGDNDPNYYQLTDNDITAQYDIASGDNILTIIYCLQMLLGLERKSINTNSSNGFGDNIQASQRYNQTRNLLEYYTNIYNSGSLSLSGTPPNGLGFLDLGLDSEIT